MLREPFFPQAVGNVIDVGGLSSNYIIAEITPYFNVGLGDIIRVHFNSAGWRYVVDTHIAPYRILCDVADIPDGDYEVYYDAEDLTRNRALSYGKRVTVRNSPSRAYPPPRFPSAVNGSLFYNTVVREKGTLICASYQEMKAGDQVTFYWQASGHPLANMPLRATVQDSDVQNGYVCARLPAENLLILGDGGVGSAYYQVGRDPLAISAAQSVTMSWNDIKKLLLTVTQGAPATTGELPLLHPCNYATLFGKPGWEVDLSVGEGALIHSSGNVTDSHTGTQTLDRFGHGEFIVYVPAENAQLGGTISVDAAAQKLPDKPANQPTTFGEYVLGDGDIVRYAYSTGAPTDGVTPCIIYFQADTAAHVTSARITVTGSATVGAYGQNATTALNSDGSALVKFVNRKEETVVASIDLVGSTNGGRIELILQFFDFPAPGLIME
jgi:hypothetical protein